MNTPDAAVIEPADDPDKSLDVFFSEVEAAGGTELSRADHEALTAAIRSDRDAAD